MGPAVDRLARRVRRLTRLAETLQELAVDIMTELSIIRQTLAEDASGRLAAAVECALLREAHARRREILEAAVIGARKMEVRWHRTGAAVVRIDEGKWFRLSRADARLLQLLTVANSDATDGFPSWRTREEVRKQIGLKTGVEPTRQAITESIYRTRQALKSADLNPYLLQVDRRLGRLRFLVRTHDHQSSSVA